jgi:hypothetical protein
MPRSARVQPRIQSRLGPLRSGNKPPPSRRHKQRDPKARTIAKYDLAVLYDPNEKMAPSSPVSIKYFARIAEKLSVDVEPITKRQY